MKDRLKKKFKQFFPPTLFLFGALGFFFNLADQAFEKILEFYELGTFPDTAWLITFFIVFVILIICLRYIFKTMKSKNWRDFDI